MNHAFFITAYKSFANLNRLLELLDNAKSTIFLHIDAQIQIPENLYTPNYAQLHILPQQYMYWASPREVKVILDMMDYALSYPWEYCHYITENDLPLKSVDEIDTIFTKENGKQFIDYSPENYEFAQYKCNTFHLFTNLRNYRSTKLIRYSSLMFAKFQYKVGFRRCNKYFLHGSAYFSITRSFATHLVSLKSSILRDYHFTLCAIEVWLQTLCFNSPFQSSIANFEKLHIGNLRYIDWTRRNGNSPYTFQCSDYHSLIDLVENSDLCFARKFDENSEVASKLFLYLKDRSRNCL